jgi:hypothetical protein
LPGFPQGKVPADVKTFNDRMDIFNKNLQNRKNELVEFLVNEETKEPQTFRHFKQDQPNLNNQLALVHQSDLTNTNINMNSPNINNN